MSALLTICNVSRYMESARLSGSSALPFLRTVIQNNEKELVMCQCSAWCRDTLEHQPADVSKLFSILVQQSKEDIFTPGLVGLAFVLLKSPQYSAINVTGIHFIEEIVKARHQLGHGILRNLKEFLFADQEAAQYGGSDNLYSSHRTTFILEFISFIPECLTRLSLTNPMMISEQLGQLKEILDFFLLVRPSTIIYIIYLIFFAVFNLCNVFASKRCVDFSDSWSPCDANDDIHFAIDQTQQSSS